MSNIISFEAENIKRLRCVRITPKGSVVVIGGENAQGKSSILDAIEMAFRGGAAIPTRPLTDGASKGYIIVKTEDYTIERRFTAAGGTSLAVTGTDGAKLTSPQAVLDALFSRVSIDPLEFTRMDSKAQAATLRKISGVDVTKLDADRKTAFDERTVVNREVTRLEGALASLPFHPDAPEVEESASAVLAEIEKARVHNGAATELNRAVVVAMGDSNSAESIHAEAVAEVTRLQAELEAAQKAVFAAADAIEEKSAALKKAEADREAFVPIDAAPLALKLSGLEETNRKVRENVTHGDAKRVLEQRRRESILLTVKLQGIDGDKATMLRKAKFPIKGISFQDDGVTYLGVPFDQASAAERLRVSMAMAFAMSPKLKVCLIRDASLLDAESMERVAEMAEAAGAQVWLERVGEGQECGIIIEDGEVKEDRTEGVAK